MELDAFVDNLASSSPAPGGGAASALVGCLAAALNSMMCNLTVGRPRYAGVEAELVEVLVSSEDLRARLRRLMHDDERAYTELMAQYALPKGSDEEKAVRLAAVEAALKRAADVPLATAEACVSLLELLHATAEKGNVNAVSDAGAAAFLANAAAQASLLNVRTNAGLMKDREAADEYLAQMTTVSSNATAASERVVAAALGRIK